MQVAYDVAKSEYTNLNSQILDILRCPDCAGALVESEAGFACALCGEIYPITESDSLDLRLKGTKRINLSLTLGDNAEELESFDALNPFPELENPEVAFSKSDIQKHVSAELLSHFTRAKTDSELALDLGCGSTIHRSILEKCGYNYVGIDYNRATAPILADAHALPFADESISLVVSVAVLEHLAHPLVALREVFRVLRPGGAFIGTVAFIEPFHGNSFYHHTHRGTANGLLTAGFEIKHLGYNPNWVAPLSLGKKFFPKVGRKLSNALVWPLHATSLLFWKIGSRICGNKKLIHLYKRDIAGSFAFSARKPER